MAIKKKFNESDRQKVIAEIERHFGVSLVRPGSSRRRNYLQDGTGRRYVVIGGYEEWHGIPGEIFESEEARLADATLVVAVRSDEQIEIFSGPLNRLLNHRDDLSKERGGANYKFHIRIRGNILTVDEAPSLTLQRLAVVKCPPAEDQSVVAFRQAFARLSPTEQADLIRQATEQLARS